MAVEYFPYTFPFAFRVPEPWKREFQIEARDASGALVRVVAQPVGATITADLNEPAELELRVPAGDPSIGALAGGNEIWISNKESVLVGKFRIGAGRREIRTSRAGDVVSVFAYDLLSQLGEEVIFYLEKTATVPELVDVLLGFQESERPITAGELPASVLSTSRTIRIEGERTIQGALRDLERTLEPWLAFYVDPNRVLQWRDLTAQANTGTWLTPKKNLAELMTEEEYDQWAMRVYAYGARPDGRPVTMADGAQGWSVYVESSAPGEVTLRHEELGYDDPSDLTGFDGASTRIGKGDFIGQGEKESEVKSVARGLSTTTAILQDDGWTVSASEGARLDRKHLDSILYGMIFYQQVVIDHNQFDPVGVADYGLAVQEISGSLAAMGQDQQGRTARIVFLDSNAEVELSAVVTTLDPVTGEIDATVAVPWISGVRPTLIFMVLGWRVT